jgi:hypothetical protein
MKRFGLIIALVAFCTILSSGAAHAALALEGVGGHVSIVSPDNVDGSVGLGFLMDMGFVGTQYGLETYAAYWSNTESAFGAEASVSDFLVGGRGKYGFITASPSLHPYVGAGLGLHYVTASVDIASYNFGGVIVPGSSVSDSEVKLGVDLGGGMTWDAGDRVSLLSDAWFTIVSDVSQFTLRLGLLYRMR